MTRGPTPWIMFDVIRNLLAWFQNFWRNSIDSCLPYKKKIYHVISNVWNLQSKNGKMLKFTDNLAICISWDSCDSKIPDKIHEDS